ncbi:uncharacterized protein LAJ45_00043 [Morchella importuna]|uniref:uncharacterized protein n=1 Tax=Morchella importuna TaxID=1174673 RepID=UPI001E8D1846|nr:uncharacterized protein LAJ45_00043 [Morchella importuna]KAH8155035.1 hypothetical protein LAJ45_00043 [Morchella importuna]
MSSPLAEPEYHPSPNSEPERLLSPNPQPEHLPNHNSHVLEHCESQCFDLMADVCDLQRELRIARALLFMLHWRNVMKQIVERRHGVPDAPYVVSSGEKLVIEWAKNLQRKIAEAWRLVDENDRLWDVELVAAFGNRSLGGGERDRGEQISNLV